MRQSRARRPGVHANKPPMFLSGGWLGAKRALQLTVTPTFGQITVTPTFGQKKELPQRQDSGVIQGKDAIRAGDGADSLKERCIIACPTL